VCPLIPSLPSLGGDGVRRRPSFPWSARRFGRRPGGIHPAAERPAHRHGDGVVLVSPSVPVARQPPGEILSRSTPMPVEEVKDEPQVEPNHVYVIPRLRT